MANDENRQNWVAISGLIEFKDGELTHIPQEASTSTEANVQTVSPYSLARTNIEFEQGTVSFEVWLNDPAGSCQIGLAGNNGAEIYAGLNSLGATYGFGVFQNSRWEAGGGAGLGTKLPTGKWIQMTLTVKGSNLELFFEGVSVVSSSQRIHKAPLVFLLQSIATIKVRNIRIESQIPECFVVMQFTEEFNELYREVIKPTCKSFGYEVNRSDDIYKTGLIIEDITRSIKQSSLIIADITPNNPNVFYEVGFSHGIEKPTILLSDRNRERLPFDVSGFRTLFYDNTIGGKRDVEEKLKKHLENIRA